MSYKEGKYNLATLLKYSPAFTLEGDVRISFRTACPLHLFFSLVVAFQYIALIAKLCQTYFSSYGYSLLSGISKNFHHYSLNLIVNHNLKVISLILCYLFPLFLKATEMAPYISNDWTVLFWVQWNLNFSV